MYVVKLLIVLLLLSHLSSAPAASAKAYHQATDEVSAEKRLKFLSKIIEESQSLRLPENRAYVYTTVADLLWKYDNRRARTLFSEALNYAEEITEGIPPDHPQYQNLKLTYERIRQTVLATASSHDASFARDLARKFINEKSPSTEVGLSSQRGEAPQSDENSSAPPEANERKAGSLNNRLLDDDDDVGEVLFPDVAKVLAEGDYNQARQIIRDRVTDPEQLRTLLDDIRNDQLSSAAKSGDEDKTRRLLTFIYAPEERAHRLVQLAAALLARSQKERAQSLLEEAQGLIGDRAENMAQLNMQLQIARGFAGVNSTRSFEVLELALNQVNSLATGILLVDPFLNDPENRLTRNDELIITSVSQMIAVLNEDPGGFTLLASTEFDRCKDIADILLRTELKIIMYIYIAKCLAQ